MGTAQEDIRVRIQGAIDGLPQFKVLSTVLKEIKANGEGKINLNTSGLKGGSADVQKLSGAITDLNKSISHIDEKQPGRLSNSIKLLSSTIQGLAAAGAALDFLKTWGERFDAIKTKGTATFQTLRSGASRIRDDFSSTGRAVSGVGTHLDRTNAQAAQLGTQGASRVGFFRNALTLLSGSAKQTRAPLTALEGDAAKLSTTLGPKSSGVISSLLGWLGQLGAGFGSTKLLAVGLVGALAAVVAALAAVGVGVAALAAIGAVALLPLLKFGVNLNSKFEQTKLGIAALIISLATLSAAGQKLDGPDALNQGLRLADAQVQKLKIDAINTVATFEQIAPAFQSAVGPGLAAGLTLDQIRETTVQIVQAAGAIGLPMHQVAQEVRAILEGTINEDARLGKILGISNELVKKWKEQGTLAKELNKRLANFTLAGVKAAETMDGLSSNFEEALNVFAGEATTKAFAMLKSKFLAILPQIFDFKNARLQQSFSDLADLLDGIFVRAIALGGDFVQRLINGAQSISRYIQANRQQIEGILTLVGSIFRAVVGIALEWGRLAGNIFTSRDAIALINVSLNLTLGLIRGLGPALAPFIESLRFSLAALRTFTAQYEFLAFLIGKAGGGVPAPAKVNPFQAIHDRREAIKRAVTDFETTVTPNPKVAGAGKGGGGGAAPRKSSPDDTFDSVFGFNKAAADSALTLLKDSLERQLEAVRESFEKRKISLRDYYDEEDRLQRQKLDFDIEAAKQAIVNERDRLAHNVNQINDTDPKELDVAEKTARVANETKNTETTVVGLNQKLVELLGKRGRLAGDLAEKEEAAGRSFQDQLQSVIDEIDRDKGLGPLVDARARIAELQVLINEARQKGNEFAAEMLELRQEQLGLEGQIYAKITQGQRAQELNEARINTLREEGSRNVLTQFLAEIKVNAIRKEQIKMAEETLRLLEARAANSTNPAVLAALERERAAVAELKNEYRTLGQTIKDTFIDSAVGGIEDFLLSLNEVAAGTLTITEAFRNMALSVIEELQKIIVKMIALKLIQAALSIFGGGLNSAAGSAGSTTGSGIGGAFAGLFGRAAAGGEFSAAANGRIIQVAEGGHDELVVTTDPKYADRTAKLLARFIRRTGILPSFSKFARGGFTSDSILSGIADRIPRFAMGDFVPAGGFQPALAGDTYNLGGVSAVFPNVKDYHGFKQNEATLKRDLGRAAAEGITRIRGSR